MTGHPPQINTNVLNGSGDLMVFIQVLFRGAFCLQP